MSEQELLNRLTAHGVNHVEWEQLATNGWWRVYANAARRDEYGTLEDDQGNCRMGAGPTREGALTSLLNLVRPTKRAS